MGTTTVSTLVVVILASSDWVIVTPIGCLRVSTTGISNMIGEVMLT
jgi:hypothetical protein